MYVLVKNGAIEKYPYSQRDLREDNPNTSFPEPMDTETLEGWGVFRVTPRNPPEHDRATQNVERVNPTLENGQWVETWEITPASAAQVEERASEEMSNVRNRRNALLAACDWTQGKDIQESVSAPWAAYRQALRDITQQDGFPWSVVWPLSPT